MNKKYLIIYHKEDNDGCCSAAIVKYYLVNELNVDEKNIKFLPANYEILSNIANSDFYYIDENCNEISLFNFDGVIITDVSFNNFDIMEIMYEHYGSNFTWIDHHLPIIKESIKRKYDTKINGVRDHTRSAILNAYKYFYDPLDIEYVEGNIPYILRVLSAWDSYSFDSEHIDFEFARRVSMGFTTIYNLDVDLWYKNISSILHAGKAYNEESCNIAYKTGSKDADEYDKRNEKLINDFGMPGFTVNGRPAMLLFMSEGTSSLIFKSVMSKFKNGICVKASPAGNILISLYNTDRNDHSFHCGEYLHSVYGGGGHEGAAGATLSIETFTKCLLEKKF